MILNGLLYVVTGVIGPFLNRFLPGLALGTLPTVSQSVLERIGAFLRFFTPIIPAGTIVAWLEIWGVVMVAAGGYIVFDWVWRHIPTIAGFGTGDG